MATAQLANNGYRIAKSWQYQDSNPLPDVNNSSDNNTPLNNNTLRPILMANYPPIQTQAKTIFLCKFCLSFNSALKLNENQGYILL